MNVKIKPLDWDHVGGARRAKSIIGMYWIEKSDKYYLFVKIEPIGGPFEKMDDAKMAAQEHYESIVRSALA